MEKIDQKRQFAAIMFTDIVGYTAMMGSDEDHAFEMLRKNKTIHEQLITEYNGKLIKEMGDGMLISFPLATDAVHCAKAIQKACKEQEIPLKIGIHEGEMVFSGDDVLGDGVNVASRLEAASQLGGITISGKVYSDVKNIKDIHVQSLGQRKLKNVDEPISIYNVLGDGEIPDEADDSAKKSRMRMISIVSMGFIILIAILFTFKIGPFALADYEKSIAVLPFEDKSVNQQSAYFVNGITEEIRRNLSKIKDLRISSEDATKKYRDTVFVLKEIADTLNVNYILLGSVLKQGEQATLFVELINTDNEKSVWSNTYNVHESQIIDIQNQITQSIASSMKVSITEDEQTMLDKHPTNNTEAYDFYLRGRELAGHTGVANVGAARFFYNRAIELDPEFALAYAWLGLSYFFESRPYQSTEDGFGDSVRLYAERAMEIDPDLSDAHWALARYYLFLKNDKGKSAVEATIAVEFDPNNGAAYGLLGLIYNADEQYTLAYSNLGKAKKLLRGDFEAYSNLLGLFGNFYMSICDYNRTIETFEEWVDYDPPQGYYWLSASSLMYGEWDKTKTYINKLCAIENQWRCTHQRTLYYACTGDFEKFLIPESEPGHIPQDKIENHWLGYIITNLEGKGEAMDFIDKGNVVWEGMIQNKRWKEPQANYELAAVSAFLGEREDTYNILHKMEDDNFWGGFLWFVQVDPRFKSLWGEDEFKQIVERREKEMANIRAELDQLRKEGKL